MKNILKLNNHLQFLKRNMNNIFILVEKKQWVGK